VETALKLIVSVPCSDAGEERSFIELNCFDDFVNPTLDVGNTRGGGFKAPSDLKREAANF